MGACSATAAGRPDRYKTQCNLSPRQVGKELCKRKSPSIATASALAKTAACCKCRYHTVSIAAHVQHCLPHGAKHAKTQCAWSLVVPSASIQWHVNREHRGHPCISAPLISNAQHSLLQVACGTSCQQVATAC